MDSNNLLITNKKYHGDRFSLDDLSEIQQLANSFLKESSEVEITSFDDLVEKAKSEFYKKYRDFYLWDEMMKCSEMRWLIDNAPLKAPIIDLCCGLGHWTSRTLKPIDLGIDTFPNTGPYARPIERFADDLGFIKNCYKAVLRADVTKPLPLPDEKIETVISICAFEHIPFSDHSGLFENIVRLLKPGGRIIYTVHLKRAFDTFDRYIEKERAKMIRQEIYVNEVYDEDYWLNRTQKAGLEILQKSGAIDRRLSLSFAMSFSADGTNFNRDTFNPEFSNLMRKYIPKDCGFFEGVLHRLTQRVSASDADILFVEARKPFP